MFPCQIIAVNVQCLLSTFVPTYITQECSSEVTTAKNAFTFWPRPSLKSSKEAHRTEYIVYMLVFSTVNTLEGNKITRSPPKWCCQDIQTLFSVQNTRRLLQAHITAFKHFSTHIFLRFSKTLPSLRYGIFNLKNYTADNSRAANSSSPYPRDFRFQQNPSLSKTELPAHVITSIYRSKKVPCR